MTDYSWCTTWLSVARADYATASAQNQLEDNDGQTSWPVSGDDIARLTRG